jgi:integrase
MAYAVKRAKGFAGYYRDAHGKRCSAGIFPTEAEAIIRAGDLEGLVTSHPSPSTTSSTTYAEHFEHWLTDVRGISPRTIIGYEYEIRKHVLPLLGHHPVAAMTQHIVRDMVDVLLLQGAGPHTVVQCKSALGRSLRPLVPDVLASNPCHGVKVAVPPSSVFGVIEPGDFQRIVKYLSQGFAMFASVLISTGARFGEAAEIRASDINRRNGDITIARRVISVGGRLGGGSRYAVLAGTKSGTNRGRTIGLPPGLATDITEWIQTNAISNGDLVFPSRLLRQPSASAPRQGRGINTTGHLANDHWRTIWYAACDASDIGWRPRPHDLRHSYATHLVASGVSIHEVQHLMGHHLIETTLGYLHRVEAMRSKATEVAEAFTMSRPDVP